MTVLPPTQSTNYLGRVLADLQRDANRDGKKLVWVLAALVGFGVIVGVIWGLWAPRDHYQTVTGGYLITNPNAEAPVGGDAVLLLMLVAAAIVTFLALWLRGPRRGLLSLLTLASGVFMMGLAAWGTGAVVTPKPTRYQLQTKGVSFDIDQRLHMFAVLLMPVIVVVAIYLILSIFSGDDDLRRRSERSSYANYAMGPRSAPHPPAGSAIPEGRPLHGVAEPPAALIDPHQNESTAGLDARSSEV